jgi:hypothetical protein
MPIKPNQRQRKIVLAPTDGVDQFEATAREFMKTIFGLTEYLITDESELGDFVTSGAARAVNMDAVVGKVMDTYHIGWVPKNLLALFRELPQSRVQ